MLLKKTVSEKKDESNHYQGTKMKVSRRILERTASNIAEVIAELETGDG
jgi:hypothetical protein